MATEIKSTSIKSQNIIAEPQANKPGSPETGQIIQATGTGDIAKGIYHYSGAAWMSLDNAQGDLETLRLIMSTDTDAVGFSSALNSTSTLAGNTNAVPHETSTGTGMLGALEVPSTGGDALLTEFDANKVFRYYSAGANNNNDYFGIPIDIPAQSRGQNIVIKFKYRTEEASADTSNGDFQVSVWDKSNGIKTTSTNTSTVAAGSDITVASSTGMAVGDKIWLESGGNAVNNVGNSITQAYITEVGSSTAIKISETWTPASTAGSLVVTGWLSDKVSGLLPAADSDTNKVGKDFSIAVKTEEDTDQIVLWISNKSTTTNVIELFFDGILVSQNKFLQASSKAQSETFIGTNLSLYSSSNARIPYINTVNENTLSQLITYSSDSTYGASFTVNEDCIVSGDLNFKISGSSTGEYFGWSVNSTQLSTNIPNINDADIITHVDPRGPIYGEAGFTRKFSKGDVIRPHGGNISSTFSDEGAWKVYITAQALQTQSIIVESQDEIFTDWQSWTPTWAGYGTVGGSFHWRRNGSNMEMLIDTATPATATGDNVSFTLPSGYVIDSTKFDTTVNAPVASAGFNTFNGGNYMWVVSSKSTESDFTKIFLGVQNGTNSAFNKQAGTGFGAGEMSGFISVPIQGWNSNFNPLLSMPLVDIGNQIEEYRISGGVNDASTMSYRPWFDSTFSTYHAGLNTIDKLGVVDNNSTNGWNFKATQNIKITATFSSGNNSAQGAWSWIKTSTDPVTFTSTTNNTSDATVFDGYRIGGGNNSYGAGQSHSMTVALTMKPGEYLWLVKNYNGNENADYIAGINICVEKDFSNTNMAHIIKPAVCQFSMQLASNTSGGDSTAGAWNQLKPNTFKGETWFVSGFNGTLGVGGTNTDFDLDPGTYELQATQPIYSAGTGMLQLISGTTVYAYGATQYTNSTTGDAALASIFTTFTLTSKTTFTLKLQTSASQAPNGLGHAAGISGVPETFLTGFIRKLK